MFSSLPIAFSPNAFYDSKADALRRSETEAVTAPDGQVPAPVRRYFDNVLPPETKPPRTLSLTHTGQFRQKPEVDWSDIVGSEFFSIPEPGFVWLGKTRLFTAVDAYVAGDGMLRVWLFGRVPIVRAHGEKINQGELLRWVAEAPWYPWALLPSNTISWEAIDDHSARVTAMVDMLRVTGVFTFSADGYPERFTAERYKEDSLEQWSGTYADYRQAEGVSIPHHVQVTWNLSEGDFTYAKFDVTGAEYDWKPVQ